MKIKSRDLTLNESNQIIWDLQEQGYDTHYKGDGGGKVYIEVENK